MNETVWLLKIQLESTNINSNIKNLQKYVLVNLEQDLLRKGRKYEEL